MKAVDMWFVKMISELKYICKSWTIPEGPDLSNYTLDSFKGVEVISKYSLKKAWESDGRKCDQDNAAG